VAEHQTLAHSHLVFMYHLYLPLTFCTKFIIVFVSQYFTSLGIMEIHYVESRWHSFFKEILYKNLLNSSLLFYRLIFFICTCLQLVL